MSWLWLLQPQLKQGTELTAVIRRCSALLRYPGGLLYSEDEMGRGNFAVTDKAAIVL